MLPAFQDKYPDLRYHEAIYWSVVTATTIGESHNTSVAYNSGCCAPLLMAADHTSRRTPSCVHLPP
jgi:hypothetical protein